MFVIQILESESLVLLSQLSQLVPQLPQLPLEDGHLKRRNDVKQIRSILAQVMMDM